jgi:hypothetical protein
MRVLVVALIVFSLGRTAFAQDENCELTLARATEEFQNGHFSSIPSILSPCIDNFTTEQQQRASILLTQTYLLLDDPVGAKQSYLRVLKSNPEFVADENIHPSDLVYLSKEFTSAPKFSWFVKAGSNVSPVRVIYDMNAFDKSAIEKYHLKFGYQAALGGEYYLDDKKGIRFEVDYVVAAFQHSTRNFFQDDTQSFSESQSWIKFPLTFTYSKPSGKYRPYGYAGFSAGFLFRDIAHGNIVRVRTAEDTRDGQQSPDWDFLYKRNKFNYAYVLGGGLKMKAGLRFLFIDVRYCLGIRNVVNTKNIYYNNSLTPGSDEFIASGSPSISYAQVDDYFRLDNLSFSFGYLHPLYRPRELKKSKKKASPKSSN